jgi:RNA polymerase-binding transcription factor DksA
MELAYAHRIDNEVLSELQQRLERDRTALMARLGTGDFSDYELTATHGQGETELAVRDEQRAVDAALQSEASIALDAVNAALARIKTGTYGRCVTCNGPIPAERLVVLPEAARCIECQRRTSR